MITWNVRKVLNVSQHLEISSFRHVNKNTTWMYLEIVQRDLIIVEVKDRTKRLGMSQLNPGIVPFPPFSPSRAHCHQQKFLLHYFWNNHYYTRNSGQEEIARDWLSSHKLVSNMWLFNLPKVISLYLSLKKRNKVYTVIFLIFPLIFFSLSKKSLECTI